MEKPQKHETSKNPSIVRREDVKSVHPLPEDDDDIKLEIAFGNIVTGIPNKHNSPLIGPQNKKRVKLERNGQI